MRHHAVGLLSAVKSVILLSSFTKVPGLPFCLASTSVSIPDALWRWSHCHACIWFLEAGSTMAEQRCAVAAPAGTGLTLPTLNLDGELADNSMATLTEAAAAVEAAVRAAATSGLPSSFPPLPGLILLVNSASQSLALEQRRKLQQEQQHSAQAAPTVKDLEQLQVQLGLLLLSCLKALHAADRYPGSSQPTSELSVSEMQALATFQDHYVGHALALWPHSSSSSSSNTSTSTSTSTSNSSSSSLHTMLMARKFYATGQLLQQLAEAPLDTSGAAGNAQLHAAGSNSGALTADTAHLQSQLQTCQIIVCSLSAMLRGLPLQPDGAVGTSAAATQTTTPAQPPASSTPSSSSSSTAAASSSTTLQALESKRQQLQDSLAGLLQKLVTESFSNACSATNVLFLECVVAAISQAAAVPLSPTVVMRQL
jgi:hypothetical protein